MKMAMCNKKTTMVYKFHINVKCSSWKEKCNMTIVQKDHVKYL